MHLSKKSWRLLLITLLTIIVCTYLFKPIYLSSPLRFGFICRFCANPQNNQLVAIRLAGEKVVTLAKVLAQPMESVQIENGQLKLDQNLSDLVLPRHFNYELRSNEATEYFVIIYNSDLSETLDFGRVKKNRLIGEIFFLW